MALIAKVAAGSANELSGITTVSFTDIARPGYEYLKNYSYLINGVANADKTAYRNKLKTDVELDRLALEARLGFIDIIATVVGTEVKNL